MLKEMQFYIKSSFISAHYVLSQLWKLRFFLFLIPFVKSLQNFQYFKILSKSDFSEMKQNSEKNPDKG